MSVKMRLSPAARISSCDYLMRSCWGYAASRERMRNERKAKEGSAMIRG